MVETTTKTHSPRDYGGIPGVYYNNTKAIQAAIDACSREGGEVVLDNGLWMTGPLLLKSNVTLRLEFDATLAPASTKLFCPAYLDGKFSKQEALLIAHEAENIEICGEGLIVGSGDKWWDEAEEIKEEILAGNICNFKKRFPEADPTYGMPRPWLIEFNSCQNIKVSGIEIQDPAMWGLVFRNCQNLSVDHIEIAISANSPQTDGIVIISSRNVTISNAIIQAGHDAVAIKSGLAKIKDKLTADWDGRAEEIILNHLQIDAGHGISIGSETINGIGKVIIQNIVLDSATYGLRIKTDRDRGNNIGPIYFSSSKMKRVKTPIMITCSYKDLAHTSDYVAPLAEAKLCLTTPYVNEIICKNIQADQANYAAVISGLPESFATNIVLENCKISSQYGIQARYVTGTLINNQLEVSTGKHIIHGPQVMLKEAR